MYGKNYIACEKMKTLSFCFINLSDSYLIYSYSLYAGVFHGMYFIVILHKVLCSYFILIGTLKKLYFHFLSH